VASAASRHYAPRVHRAVIALLVAGCGSHAGPSVSPSTASKLAPAEDKRVDGPPLATPGEHMQYKLSLQGVDLATYEIGIGEISDLDGAQTITVQGAAKTTGFVAFLAKIDDRFTSWVDIATGRPVRFETDEYASGSKSDVEHAVVELGKRADDAVPVHFHVNDKAATTEAQHVSQPVVWDYNAFMLVLRSWETPIGQPRSFEVFRSRWLWHVDVTIHGKEKLVTELGDLPALRIDGSTYKLDRKGVRDPGSPERHFTMWISDDDGRVPLEIKAVTDYGDLRVQIVDYQPGSGKRLRP
jgi:hypothetical protein